MSNLKNSKIKKVAKIQKIIVKTIVISIKLK